MSCTASFTLKAMLKSYLRNVWNSSRKGTVTREVADPHVMIAFKMREKKIVHLRYHFSSKESNVWSSRMTSDPSHVHQSDGDAGK